MDNITQVYVWDKDCTFHEKYFTSLEIANAWLDKNYPNAGQNDMDAADGYYEIHEHEVIKELD